MAFYDNYLAQDRPRAKLVSFEPPVIENYPLSNFPRLSVNETALQKAQSVHKKACVIKKTFAGQACC